VDLKDELELLDQMALTAIQVLMEELERSVQLDLMELVDQLDQQDQ